MTLEEVRQLLATIAGYDGRAVDARTIHDWHAILQPIEFGLAAQAVRLWYSENRGYIQPHDVAVAAARVAGIDREPSITQRRLEGTGMPWDSEKLAGLWPLPQIERKNQDEEQA